MVLSLSLAARLLGCLLVVEIGLSASRNLPGLLPVGLICQFKEIC